MTLRVSDVKRRQLTYLKRVHGEIRYLLGLYYRSYRLAHYMHRLGQVRGGLWQGLSWGGLRLGYLLCILRFTAHLWESRYLISQGAVLVNGRVCKDPEYWPCQGDCVQLICGRELMYYQHCVRRVYWRRWKF